MGGAKEREHWMDTVYKLGSAVSRIVQSRAFAASVLAAVSAIIVVVVSLNVKAVTIVDGDSTMVVLTLDNDPVRVVSRAGIKLEQGDKIVAESDLRVLSVNRASEVKITADGITTVLRMSGGTVSDALQEVGLELDQNDAINVSLNQEINDGLDIKIDRISYEEYSETITEKFTTQNINTTVLKYGKSLIKQAGVNGKKTVYYRKTIKNGEVVKTEVVKEVVHQKMVPQIKLVGVKPGTPHNPPPYPIKLDSKGPVFYKQTRYGKDGKPFKAWKFRTMVENADVVLKEYLARHPELKEEWDRDQKLRDDPRVTRVGKFLRKTSLDELPQIFNVIKGEMSVVGPRPISKSDRKYGKYYSFILKLNLNN